MNLERTSYMGAPDAPGMHEPNRLLHDGGLGVL